MQLKLSTLFFLTLLFWCSTTIHSLSQVQTIQGLNVKELTLSSQANSLALGTVHGKVIIYTQNQGLFSEIQALNDLRREITFVDMSGDGEWLMVGDEENNIYVHHHIPHTNRFQLNQKISLGEQDHIFTGKMVWNKKILVVGTDSAKLIIFKFKGQQFQKEKIFQLDSKIHKISTNENSDVLVVNSRDEATMIDLEKEQIMKIIPFSKMSINGEYIAEIEHSDYKQSWIKILRRKGNLLSQQNSLHLDYQTNQISLLQNKLILTSNNRVIIFSRSTLQKIYEFEAEDFVISSDGKVLVIREVSGDIKIYRENTLILSQNQQNNTTIAWYWIMIIAVSGFMLVVFIVIILYQWVCKGTQSEHKEVVSKSPENSDKLDEKPGQSMKSIHGKEDKVQTGVIL